MLDQEFSGKGINMWKVIVADDEPFIREALKEMIPWDELGCHLAEAL